MIREIILDAETTGLDPAQGDRLVEIACLEMVDRRLTGQVFHRILDPERPMPAEAARIHGLTDEKLRGRPKFHEVVEALLDFIGESPLVIHNAAFDLEVLAAELKRAGRAPVPEAQAVDTLLMARRKFPGAQAGLDALAERFGVDASRRGLQGAEAGCEVLAEVYLALLGERPPTPVRREIILDTETTGFDPAAGDRLVEVACLEMIDDRITENFFHRIVDPERAMPAEAAKIHGLTDDKLRGQPKFREIADEFLEFIGDSPLVIHNAAFDMKFLAAELKRAGRAPVPDSRAVDTLLMARRKFPGAPASLDALCKRFGVENAGRDLKQGGLHGAKIDCEVLAEVYLALQDRRKGQQAGLNLDVAAKAGRSPGAAAGPGGRPGGAEAEAARRPGPRPILLSEAERAAHEAFVAGLGEQALWRKPS